MISDASIRSDVVEASTSEPVENLVIDEASSITIQQIIESPVNQPITNNNLIRTVEIPLEPVINQPEPVINQPEPVINQPEPVINQPEPETPTRLRNQSNLETPTILSATPMASTSISDTQPRTSKRERRVSPRGQLEKRSRKENQAVNFAPRQQQHNQKFWILDYEYDTYTKQLRKKNGYDEFRTAHF